MNFSGKTALLTGGTDGIGLRTARQLKAKGVNVILRAHALADQRGPG